MIRCLIAVALVGSIASNLWADGPTFITKPTVAKADRTVISFEVSAATDVEVAVIDGQGRMVRHLAAGLLGKNAPPPLKADSLKQAIEWDGKDDLGKPAPAGCSVRVSLAMRPTYDSSINDNPAALGQVATCAVGPSGEVYILHNHGSIHPDDDTGCITVFSRDGSYLRTILPYSAKLGEDKLAGLRRIKLTDGRTIPFIYNAELRAIVPGSGMIVQHQPVVTPDGRLVFIGHLENLATASRYNVAGTHRVVAINSDGSMPPGGPLKTVLARNTQSGAHLAVAPDGKTFYASGVVEGYSKGAKPRHCIYKFTLDDQEPAVFIGDADEAGDGPNRLNKPAGVAADKDGNIYVADRGNNRVAVFKADGSFLGQLKVEGLDRIAVHSQTGAIYVTAGDATRTLFKFASYKATSPSYQLDKLPFWTRPDGLRDSTTLTVDSSAAGSKDSPVYIYYGGRRLAGKLARIADNGESLGDLALFSKLTNSPPGFNQFLFLALDRKNERLYLDGDIYDLRTSKMLPGLSTVSRKAQDSISTVGTKGGAGGFGLDGMIYMMGYPNWLKRYDADLKPAPFPASDQKDGSLAGEPGGSLRLRARGVTADANGVIFALWQKPKSEFNCLSSHNPDGSMKNARLIDADIRGIESVRLDYQGNIYLMVNARPRGMVMPEEFRNVEFPPTWQNKGGTFHDINWYEMLYGCIAKFPPEGGSILSGDDGVPMVNGLPSRPNNVSIKGAKWIAFGASPAVSWRAKYPDTCLCEAAQFDVDGFGRSFYPDAAQFRVRMLDTAGNDLGNFGSYGNTDDKPAGGTIPMFWPYNICVGNGKVYVADRVNRRVLVVKLNYAATEICPAGN